MLPLTLEQVFGDRERAARFLADRMVTNVHERGNCSVVCMQRLPYDLARGALRPDEIQGYAVNRNVDRLRAGRTGAVRFGRGGDDAQLLPAAQLTAPVGRWTIEPLETQRQKIVKILLFWSLFVLQVLIVRRVWENPDMTVFIAGNLVFFFVSIFATGLLTKRLSFTYQVLVLGMLGMLMLGFAVR